jgi:hypothetical protein
MARACRSRCLPLSWASIAILKKFDDHRLPKQQGSAKRGSALDPQGFDAGKKITGRKRHILVDTLGLLLGVSVHAADIQDRDDAHDLLRQARRRFPFVQRISLTAAIRVQNGADCCRDRMLEDRDHQAFRSPSLRLSCTRFC